MHEAIFEPVTFFVTVSAASTSLAVETVHEMGIMQREGGRGQDDDGALLVSEVIFSTRKNMHTKGELVGGLVFGIDLSS